MGARVGVGVAGRTSVVATRDRYNAKDIWILLSKTVN